MEETGVTIQDIVVYSTAALVRRNQIRSQRSDADLANQGERSKIDNEQ